MRFRLRTLLIIVSIVAMALGCPPARNKPLMFRFTIRDVLWLTALVALAVGWAVDHWQSRVGLDWQGAYEVRVEALEERGYAVTWSEVEGGHILWLTRPPTGTTRSEYTIPPGRHYTARPLRREGSN